MTKFLLACIALLSFSGVASAVEVTATWTLPTTRVDGTALAPTDLAKTVVEYGTCGTDTIAVVEGSVDALSPATTAKFQRAPGPVCVRAYVVDTEGRRSDNSGTYQAIIESDANPSAPIILQLALLPLPVSAYVVYHPTQPTYKSTPARIVVDGVLKTGDAMVAVGVPCNCSLSVLDADGRVWCGIEGQIQVKYTTKVGSVRKGDPFPYGYVSTCRAA